ncbi:OprO/OprP family phosphate-selective porin [Spongiibacter taiwanensis]|uniref:OprO/OprP family phosphate-selective porin n=1 Tax=Spongiibacter taiwanensis TaxID=1748242 RepID=UPI0020363D51|nr:OprO/OprP family phosphate-selective porin [Spongiibacter taiwanensis]USA42901.1 OprO/OprP family phosphate-selective porin [Spongiibacter taiwanensis]
MPLTKLTRPKSLLLAMTSTLALGTSGIAVAEGPTSLELYVDTTTKQVFTEPGPGRTKLGNFQAVGAGSTATTPTLSMDKKGLGVSSSDGNFEISLGGRLHIDASTQSGDDNLTKDATAGTEIRRSRLALKGKVYNDYKFHLEMDFADDAVAMKDAMVTFTGIDGIELTVGNQKHAISMEMEESSNDIMFVERSLLSALTTPHFDRAIGVNLKAKGDNWSLQGGLYGDAVASDSKNNDEGHGVAIRGTYTPLMTATEVLHFGASAGQRKATDDNTLSNNKSPRFRYETTHISDLYLSDTGVIADFEDITFAGLEAAYMAGPFSIQSEMGKAYINRANGAELEFDAYYVQAAWTLTGESRSYKGSDGEFKRLKPAANFDLNQGTWGAWELALRLDELNLTDEDIGGGEQQRFTLALNWYLNENLRIMLDYSRAFDVTDGPVTHTDGSDADDLDTIQLRTQFAF